jgi:threonine aldolase
MEAKAMIEEMKKIYALAQKYGLRVHLDGARIWNASAAKGIPLAEYARYTDSVSACFSKGLGAPVGSIVAGSRAFIEKAHRYRKLYGGGMRQAGILAAAALFALKRHLSRLPEDHRRARQLAEILSAFKEIQIDLQTVQTNIVIFHLVSNRLDAQQFVNRCKEAGLLMLAIGGNRVRLVTHLHISDDDVARAEEILRFILR